MNREVGIVLLAAGKSQRFKQATGRHKLLERLPGSDRCILECSIGNIKQTERPLIVVLCYKDLALQEICRQMSVRYICIDSRGMGESIAAGVKETAQWTGWIISLADMPFISPDIFKRVAVKVADDEVVRPVYKGQPGHPVGFPMRCRPLLEALKEEQGARKILEVCPPFLIEVEEVGCVWDIDLPEQLAHRPTLSR